MFKSRFSEASGNRILMLIKEVSENKKEFLDLLLLADEKEDMVDLYLERGTMYVLYDDGVKAEVVVTDEGDGVLEIKNIATVLAYQRRGYARKLIDFIVEKYAASFSALQVGTGDKSAYYTFLRKMWICAFACSEKLFYR